MTNKDTICVAMSPELRATLDSAQKELGYTNRSELIRIAIIEFVQNKIDRGDKAIVQLPSELRQVLEKVASKKETTVDELATRIIQAYVEERWLEFVSIRYPTADKYEDLSSLEKIDLYLLSKQTGVTVEKCFEEMLRKRALHQSVTNTTEVK